MIEKEKTTLENVHKKLSNVMEDAYVNDMFEEIKEPNLDLSFLTEEKTFERKYNKFVRFAAIAAVTIIVLLGANIVLLSSDDIVSYGDKGILHRLYVSINGIFTDKSDEQLDDIANAIEISSEKNYEEAKKFLPQIYWPEYIPNGYKLDKLYIEKYNSGDAISTYSYSNNRKERFEIVCVYCQTAEFDYEYNGSGEIFELDDRTLFLEWDDIQEEYSLTVYTENCTINICSENCLDKNEILMIGKNMKL